MSKIASFIQLSKMSLYLNRKLIIWLTLVFGTLFLITANTLPQISLLYHGVLFIGGALISGAAFKEIHDKNAGIHYLTLPVTSGVRYLALWTLTGPAYFVFISLLYAIGIFAHILGGNFWNIAGNEWSFLLIAINYLIVNALFLLGGIYFKRLPLLKTLGVLLILSLVFAMIKGAVLNGGWLLLFSNQIFHLFWLGLGILAWVLAFVQLKKTELY